jgi:hypothetical protein
LFYWYKSTHTDAEILRKAHLNRKKEENGKNPRVGDSDVVFEGGTPYVAVSNADVC